MTGRDLGHVITWDFLIFLLKLDIWLINSWYFLIPGTSRLHITAINQPNRPKWILGIHLGRGLSDVTKVERYARPASFLQLSRNFGRNAQLWSKGCPKVKTCSAVFYLIRFFEHKNRIIFLFNAVFSWPKAEKVLFFSKYFFSKLFFLFFYLPFFFCYFLLFLVMHWM